MKRLPEQLTDGVFDLLIIGGGITGAGVALDATLRGFRVALIDKADFASGTSSVSSKLVHGGLRYLEHGDVHLVYEALHERRLLLQNAPHLVWPLRFVIPFYEGARVPGWKFRAGLTLYDLLAGAGNIRRSGPLHRAAIRREFPGLRGAGLCGGAEYWDAGMDDARLCLEVVRTAAGLGVTAVNYVEAVALRPGEVEAVDRTTGRAITVRARQVLNAAGPWVDQVCRLAGDDSGPKLRPTKGVHLLAPGRGLTAAFLLLHPRDGRVFFVIPWLGKTLLGTTDTLAETDPDHLAVTPEDVTYLLEGHNHFFTPPLGQADLLGSFVGLRPLVRDGPWEPSALSREFRLFAGPSGMLSAAGGKYTTYRHMAEVITDAVAERFGGRRLCRTRHYLLDGAPRRPWDEFAPAAVAALVREQGLPEGAARHLVARYGRRAPEVAAICRQRPGLLAPLVPGEPDLRGELTYQREQEMALYPADHLLRRTRLGLFHPELLRSGDFQGRPQAAVELFQQGGGQRADGP